MSDHKIVMTALADLVPADLNPKKHALKDLRASMGRFGFTEPIMVDERTQKIVAGHGRLETAAALFADGADAPAGIDVSIGPDGSPVWLVPVVRGWASKDDTEAQAYLVASNRLTQLGGWDNTGLAEILEEVERNAGLAGTGYDNDDLAELRRLLEREDKPALTGVDDVPKKPKKARSELGDVYLLGEHRLVCGDSRDGGTIREALGGKAIDLVFTDPPYGVSYGAKNTFLNVHGGGRGNQIETELDSDELSGTELSDFLTTCFQTTLAHCRPGAVWFVCSPPGPNNHLFGSVLGRLGIWRQTIIWVKDQFVLGRGDFHYRHEVLFAGEAPLALDDYEEPPDDGYEDIRFGWVPGSSHRRPMTRRLDTIWEIPRPHASKLHPTMKPVELVQRGLEASSAPRDVVFDPFSGSGSTLIACHTNDRVFCGIELSPAYVDVICKRFEEHTGITPELEGRGARSFLQDS